MEKLLADLIHIKKKYKKKANVTISINIIFYVNFMLSSLFSTQDFFASKHSSSH